MEQSKVDTASTYVNNLLLARGLLRDAKPIDFARLSRSAPVPAPTSAPDRAGRSKPEQAPATAAAEIINLVHDLVLRRDRDQEQHESVALTLRTLRAEASRESAELARLAAHNADLRRQLAAQQAAARAAEQNARSAEASARSLRDEGARLKTVLQQVRTQCANDVRRRDVELAKLKTHLATRQRGNKAPLVGASISITPGSSGRAAIASSQQQQQQQPPPQDEDRPSVEDAAYNLTQETTEFLTQLSQGLSEENDSLIGLIRTTLHTLKDLLGLPHNQAQREPPSGSSMGRSTAHDEPLVQCPPTSFQILSTDLDSVLSNLCELLTNPSFAPIEEVHSREEEIVRLKDGWLKMETRWHEAIGLMQGWKKRMLNGGGNVNVDELRNGLRLGEGLDSPSRQFSSTLFGAGVAHAELDAISEPSELDDEPNIDDFSEVEEDYVPREDDPVLEAAMAAQPSLQEIDSNAVPVTRASNPGLSDREAKENNQTAAQNEDVPAAKPKTTTQVPKTAASGPKSAPSKLTARKPAAPQPRAAGRRVPKPQRPAKEPEPVLSVDEKLRLAESEARRVSSSPLEKRSQLARSKSKSQGATASTKEARPAEGHAVRSIDAGKKEPIVPVKRSRISGRPRRRKSTLSPEELEELMGS